MFKIIIIGSLKWVVEYWIDRGKVTICKIKKTGQILWVEEPAT